MSIPNCHWIVVEDSIRTSPWIREMLTRLNIKHTLLACTRTPEEARAAKNRKAASGSVQRNRALDWIVQAKIEDGVIYFVDDDNTFDLRVFEEVRADLLKPNCSFN